MSELPELRLLEFIPFRITRLATKVGDHFAAVYEQRFGFGLPEWRVLTTVAQTEACTASDIVHATEMHKTRVSRAIADLADLGLIMRDESRENRRELQLHLTDKGRSVYAEIVPLALEREAELMGCLSPTERKRLEHLVSKLERALGLQQADVESRTTTRGTSPTS